MVPKLFWLTAPLNIFLAIHGTHFFNFVFLTSFVPYLYFMPFNVTFVIQDTWSGHNLFLLFKVYLIFILFKLTLFNSTHLIELLRK